ncbi:MAG TPA: glycine zipper 2TM domain-containing protein [Rhizomicrobium sp.]|nr:glycine zipper 2TM domain-containing protein [Rhizomicrobium sp.]
MLTRTGKILAAAAIALGASTAAASARDYYGDDCRDQNRTAGTVAGAIIGGIIGNSVGRGGGRAAATVGGVVLGGIAGNAIAGDIDCDDRPYAFRTYNEGFRGRIGERYEWRHRDNYGYFTPEREYWRDGMLCRDFEETTYHHGREYTREGTACRDEDGDWRMM